MMHRSQWATKYNQQRILAIWLRRSAFDSYLAQAVHSSHKDRPKNDKKYSKYNNAVLPKEKVDQLRVPIQRVYEPEDEQTRDHIQLDS
jgi:hypothetical protein